MNISKNKKKQINALIEKCKSKQGEYLPSHHGSGSWATTYSTEFINAASELYVLFQDLGLGDPLYLLSNKLRAAGIRSCRGAEFHVDRVDYLYNTHLCFRIEELRAKQKKKPVHNKVACMYCDKMVVDITQHVSQSHPESWLECYAKSGVNLKGKTRCTSCGSFLKSMDGHKEKCLRTLEVRN
ncbi:hypothetical protein SN11_20245 [Vibrio harveyi]|nr:hypothetical protein SN11_20245 [Vibrio harveyi]